MTKAKKRSTRRSGTKLSVMVTDLPAKKTPKGGQTFTLFNPTGVPIRSKP